jgi:NAD(P)-dependent dehydrogenase (short-subunit alcohol dehydrogenase family)
MHTFNRCASKFRRRNMLLDGRLALVTGGSRGIGFEIAKIFVEQGASVIVASRAPAKLDWAAGELPSVDTIQADVVAPADLDRLVARVGERRGKLDILVNNAGHWTGDQPDLTTPGDDEFTSTIQTNLFGAYFTTKRFLPLLEKSDAPRIINVGSTSGLLSPNLRSTYGVSKLALHGLSIATANELAGRVALNVLSPGWVRTDMAPDAPNEPRMSAEAALEIVTQDWAITGKLFHATPSDSGAPATAVEREFVR